MKLSKLLKRITTKAVIGNTDLQIDDIVSDSRSATKNSLFICIDGKDSDGHNFVCQAENYGAIAIVTKKQLETSLTQIIVDDTRVAMSELASEFFGRADERLSIIGVTGTNGKTTTSSVIYDILNASGVKTALIGTLGTFYDNKIIEPTLTTPDPLVLHRQFREMLDSGVKVVVMEVSAHALYYDKLKGIDFTACVFTNFTQDHLDFFKDMKEYKKAKLKLFSDYKAKYVITNSDDEVGREIAQNVKGSISYGVENPADVFAIKINEKANGTSFVINIFDMIYDVKLKLMGRFNVYNVMAASTVSALLGVEPDKIIEVVNNIECVSGRLERVYNGDYSVYVDYAHTPDGLKKSIMALKNVCKGRLVCVFGCGGNRDKDKRKKMGQISGKLADFTIVTSDNPRYEEPLDIMFEIEKGILQETKNYLLIQDRADAIKYAINYAKIKDIILIAGKGSEKYQEILGVKRMYNDKDTVEEIIRSVKS